MECTKENINFNPFNVIKCIFAELEGKIFRENANINSLQNKRKMDFLKLASLKLLLTIFSVLAWAVNSSHERQGIKCPTKCICGTTSTLQSLLPGPNSMQTPAINCTGTKIIAMFVSKY